MFRCEQCHREFGGIRGIATDSCPRCRPQESAAEMWTGESPGSNWSPLPLLGPIAQLDRTIRAQVAGDPATLLSTVK
jgi:hypothetical protein